MPRVPAVVKANTFLFMSLTLSRFYRTSTGELQKGFQLGWRRSKFGKVLAWAAVARGSDIEASCSMPQKLNNMWT
jgi:hypothetical protein